MQRAGEGTAAQQLCCRGVLVNKLDQRGSNVPEKLVACHERIHSQLGTLERLAPHLETKGCDAEAKSAAQAVLRYFDTSGAMHHQDEDQDLFPVLRTRAAGQARADITTAIDEL